MSNKPANRPGHPVHGFQRRYLRSAKARMLRERAVYAAMNKFSKQIASSVKGLDKFTKEDANGSS